MTNITYSVLNPPKTSGKSKKRLLTFVCLVLVAMPAIRVSLFSYSIAASSTVLSYAAPLDKQIPTWPDYGQTAIRIGTEEILSTVQSPKPTASTAKMIVALSVLNTHPLTLGEQGPAIEITQKDIERYNQYFLKQGSLVSISLGTKVSEYDALQMMMLASANNVADMLAEWAFGTLENYHVFANEYVRRLGATDTIVANDASGLSPLTVSTAKDLVIIGEELEKNPVLAEIVNKQEAIIPNVGIVRNTNGLLIQSTDVKGIKTGNSDEAGGVFVLHGNTVFEEKKVTITVCVMGAPTSREAMQKSYELFTEAKNSLQKKVIVHQNEKVSELTTDWNKKDYALIAEQNISVIQSSFLPVTTVLIEQHSFTHLPENFQSLGVAYVKNIDGSTTSTPLNSSTPLVGASITEKIL